MQHNRLPLRTPQDEREAVIAVLQGAWTLTFKDVATAAVLGESGSGSGSQVPRHEGGEDVLSFTADNGLFSVWADYRLIVNGIGPQRDEGLLPSRPTLLRVESAAPWQYSVR